MMDEFTDSLLGKKTVYADQYNPNVLFPINRDASRTKIGIDVQDLPFRGVDIWNGFDFTWLNTNGQPEYGMLTIYVPCESANIIESKSLKLYLYSFANTKYQAINEIITSIEQDLSAKAGDKVRVSLANILLDFMHVEPRFAGTNLDGLNVKCDAQEISPQLLTSDSAQIVSEQLCSDLLKFNSPVTGKPDWGSVRITYTGAKLDQEGLLQYIISYRNQAYFHEQCIEQIYFDILQHCQPSKLIVEGRYTRRCSLDLNPIRANVQFEPQNHRLFRQ